LYVNAVPGICGSYPLLGVVDVHVAGEKEMENFKFRCKSGTVVDTEIDEPLMPDPSSMTGAERPIPF